MRAALAVVVALVLAGPAAAMTMDSSGDVSIGFAAYTPVHFDALTGQTLTWTNDSVRNHTVTARDNTYDSGVLARGDTWRHAFTAPGTYAYYCRLHAGIVGDVTVHDVLLDPAEQPAAPNRAYPLSGRAAPGIRQVGIEADSGSGFAPVGTATVGDDGRFTATVTPSATTAYRATTPADTSPAVTLLVLDRRISFGSLHRHGHRWSVTATVTPPSPGAHVVLELRLREHFGWWPVAHGRLNPRSHVVLRTPRRSRAPARVVLTLADWATPLAISPSFPLGP